MNFTGIGCYSLDLTAKLIHEDSSAVRRWLFGYSYSNKAGGETSRRFSAPLWQTQYSKTDLSEKVVGFRDLLELRIVREFVKSGVHLLVVRNCLNEAKRIFSTDYPFTTKRFLTDGKTIFYDAVEKSGEARLLDLKRKQYVFREIIKPSLYNGIEYEGNFARRWYPDNAKSVVIDPELQFGKPIVADSGIATEALYATYLAEGKDKQMVARLFEIPVKQVENAIRFEQAFARAA